jgi:hypothetical protein
LHSKVNRKGHCNGLGCCLRAWYIIQAVPKGKAP